MIRRPGGTGKPDPRLKVPIVKGPSSRPRPHAAGSPNPLLQTAPKGPSAARPGGLPQGPNVVPDKLAARARAAGRIVKSSGGLNA